MHIKKSAETVKASTDLCKRHEENKMGVTSGTRTHDIQNHNLTL